MRRMLCFALLATALALPAAASAACVTYTPGPVLLGSPSGSPVHYVVRAPGSVSVTPTDCI